MCSEWFLTRKEGNTGYLKKQMARKVYSGNSRIMGADIGHMFGRGQHHRSEL